MPTNVINGTLDYSTVVRRILYNKKYACKLTLPRYERGMARRTRYYYFLLLLFLRLLVTVYYFSDDDIFHDAMLLSFKKCPIKVESIRNLFICQYDIFYGTKIFLFKNCPMNVLIRLVNFFIFLFFYLVR